MDCPACGRPNPSDARFCGTCSASLTAAVQCPGCGASNAGGQRFCNSCGQELPTTARRPDLRPSVPEHLAEKVRGGQIAEGERKQVTVLFADVMGSMDLAEQQDPEAWRLIMDRFVAILCEGVHRFEGTVDKFTGDGVMALFGAPVAHEDHAQRACFAALHLQKELAAYAAQLRREHGLNFSVRIGINSGEVVAGSIGEDLDVSYTAIGHTVGLAQRMEQLAEPGTAYVTQHTASLVAGYVELADLGEFQIKGASRPVRVHQVTGIGAARGRLDVSRARGFSKFVGREDELAALQDALDQSLAGRPQVIGIVGEAGVGKSRLCDMFMRRCRARGVPVYHTSGLAHATSTPLVPVLHIMRSYFDVTDLDSEQTARERIAGKLLLLDASFGDDLPLLFEFLGVADQARPAQRMDPEARQRRLLDLVKRLVRAESRRTPGVNVFEDLHWLDPGSELFVANHLDASQGGRSLTILNFRPDYQASWMSKSYYRQMALAPLGPEAVEQLLADLLGSDPSVAAVGGVIRERTAGNPFFVEEVVLSLAESGALAGERGDYTLAGSIDGAAVPAGVQAVLSARIDRLDERDKGVLGAAAVIGKQFAQPVLARVTGLEPERLGAALEQLVSSEFIFEQELYPEAVYAFKHPLTQEVAYRSQLGERRIAVHAAVARAMEAEHPDRLDEWAALLAQHWEQANEPLEAARWHARAGAWAGSNDPTASFQHWSRVRELTDAVPQSEETSRLGLTARIFALGYGWRLGMSDQEADALFTEAEQMASRANDLWARTLLLSNYASILFTSRAQFRAAVTPIEQAIALAEEAGDPALYLCAAGGAYVFFLLGDYRAGLELCDRGLEIADGDADLGANITLECPLVQCMMNKGGMLCELGRLDEAAELIETGKTIAAARGANETVGWSHNWGVWHAYHSGDAERATVHAEAALRLAERIGDAFSRTWTWVLSGLAATMRGDWQQAIDAVERAQAISSGRRSAADSEVWWLMIPGEAHANLGDGARAVELCREAAQLARDRELALESVANVVLARVLRLVEGRAARGEIESALARADELVRALGSVAVQPTVYLERAELARLNGDEAEHERNLREALRLFEQIGATGHAARVTGMLTALVT